MLKLNLIGNQLGVYVQPPSGGCVLKQALEKIPFDSFDPAAFRRLCVETVSHDLCKHINKPAAFRRLCVETISDAYFSSMSITSRLQAAVC